MVEGKQALMNRSLSSSLPRASLTRFVPSFWCITNVKVEPALLKGHMLSAT